MVAATPADYRVLQANLSAKGRMTVMVGNRPGRNDIRKTRAAQLLRPAPLGAQPKRSSPEYQAAAAAASKPTTISQGR